MRISVVTPSFKQLAFLKLCVASVADQQGVQCEHIIQDAGTGAELEKWGRAQPRVRLFVEKDDGMYDAINRGLRRSTGEICAYLNCDEQYLPGTLASVAQFFSRYPDVDVLFGDVVLIDPDGYPLSYRRVTRPTLSHIRTSHLNTPTCATFFRRRILERGFYFDTQWRVIGDVVWMEHLLKNGFKMATLPKPLSVFAFTGENLGESARNESESRRWRSNFETTRWQKMVDVAGHRLRKLLAGAYFKRTISIEVFTLNSALHRQCHTARVGFGWPGRTALALGAR